jgi:hypothetical protein
MIPEMGSLTQKASDARPHHWGEPTKPVRRANRPSDGAGAGNGQAPHSGRPSPQGETGGLRLGAMGRRHKKQDARVGGAGEPLRKE